MRTVSFLWGGGTLLLFAMFILGLASGSSDLRFTELIDLLRHRLGYGPPLSEELLNKDLILWSIRLPRVLMAALSGAGLSLVGAAIQALVRNPMADPWLLGVSSGASLGAVLVLVSGLSLFGGLSLQIFAFFGASLASGLIYFFSRRSQIFSSTRLIFSGLAISFCLEALTQVVIFTAARKGEVQNVMFWTMGSLGSVESSDLLVPSLALLAGFSFLFRSRTKLNIACLSELKAFSLGLDLQRFRRNVFLVSAALTAVLVSVTGSIGFVGLMVPHVLRLLLGNDYRLLIPGCLLGGASFMIAADALARSFFSPQEIPIGIITALLGSPIFLWLMRSSNE